MAYPDYGPLMDEHLDELELIVRAGQNDGHFTPEPKENETLAEVFVDIMDVMGWIDRHAHKVLAASRWALEHGFEYKSEEKEKPE